jgi:hypothetical protein
MAAVDRRIDTAGPPECAQSRTDNRCIYAAQAEWGQKRVGTALALRVGMAIYTSTPANDVQEVQWLHWLFVREGHMLSCDVDVRGDGLYRVSLFPLWAPEDVVTQSFQRPGEALQRHAEIASHLRASGWLVADRGPVLQASA